MRLWYWFLLIVFLVGIGMFALGMYYIRIDEQLGYDLFTYSMLPIGFVLAVALLYFQRWMRR